MEQWTAHRVRETFLRFFRERGHAVIPSASLIPDNDPSTLFTGSGMQPMVPYLLGEPHPQGTRLADSQKCFRSQDIDEVGDNRHTTFFEMLGNWSFGDYFKREQIGWMYEFLTKEIGLDSARLFITVFRGSEEFDILRDEEAAVYWQEQFTRDGVKAEIRDHSERDGMREGRIFFYDEHKNWWSRSGIPERMPVGEPGGPDSEMFWDFGASRGLHESSSFAGMPCHVNCDCGRFLEIGNNVFMQFRKTETGFEPLKKRNLDFGGGLERLVAAATDDPDIFRIDCFSGALAALERRSRARYGVQVEQTKAFRIVLDHLRAATFLIGDGVFPSNKDQGYFVRRLIRRAVRFGGALGVKDEFCSSVADAFIATYTHAYPNLDGSSETIRAELAREEGKFRETLARGESEFTKIFATNGSVSGEDAFVLYSTYGFPLELTKEIAGEHGQHVDTERFDAEFRKHQELSRAGSEQKFAGGLADHSDQSIRYHTATHLTHQALRAVLGPHVEQRGSNITPERMRFDFTHGEKLSAEQVAAVQQLVQQQIDADLPVSYMLMDVEQAKASGVIGLFDDAYAKLGGKVKVYSVGDTNRGYFSREICGGPHVARTSMIGKFHITKEEACARGIRRIRAVVDVQPGGVEIAAAQPT